MSIYYIKPVINKNVRNLCFKAYTNHPKGCPNFNKRDTCPPKVCFIDNYFDLNKVIIAVVIHFNLKQHVQRMQRKHPDWSQRQLECCLYWQNTARKQLQEEVTSVLSRTALFDKGRLITTDCPEAMGVDVTATMKNAGLILEWPPKKIVRKIAFIGTEK
jgi:predicted metal-binding protein